MTYPFESDRLVGSPETRFLRAVNRKHNLTRAKTSYPFFVDVRNRQIRLILEHTLAAARNSIRSATNLVNRRADAAMDSFLRHQLHATAHDVAVIEGVLEASLWPDDPGPPCLVGTLTFEICKLERFYSRRIGPIDRRMGIENFTPSWTAEIIFRLIARAVICDAFDSAPPDARLSIQLLLLEETICLIVDGAGYCTEQALMLRIDRPKQFKLLLHALSASLVSRPNGVSINIPVAACAPLDVTDNMTLLCP
jgi:hypothetical protein